MSSTDDIKQLQQDIVTNRLLARAVETKVKILQGKIDKAVETKTRQLIQEIQATPDVKVMAIQQALDINNQKISQLISTVESMRLVETKVDHIRTDIDTVIESKVHQVMREYEGPDVVTKKDMDIYLTETNAKELLKELGDTMHREMDKLSVSSMSQMEKLGDSMFDKTRKENERLRSEFISIKQTEEKLVGIVDRLTRELVQAREELTLVKGALNTTQTDLATTNVTMASNRQANRRELEDKENVILRFVNAKNDELLNKYTELAEKTRRDMTGDIYSHLEDLLQLSEFKNQAARDTATTILTTEQRMKKLDQENLNRINDINKLRGELLSETGHIMQMLSQQQQRPRGFGRRF